MSRFWEDRYLPFAYRKPWKKYRLWNIPIPDRFHHALLKRGWLSQKIDQFYDDSMQESLEQLHRNYQFDAVVVNYAFFSKALEVFPDSVLKVIDTHDVYTDRHKRLLESGLRPEWFFTSRAEEKKGLQRAHCVIAIQSKEAEFFKKLVGEKIEVETVGHLFEPLSQDQIAPIQRSLRFGMLGSNNLLNVQAFNWFVDQVMGELPADFNLTLWGSVGDFVPNHPQVQKKGIVEDITSAYRKADVFLNPMQWGTGLKIKTLEALSYGRLVISTPCGLEGIEDAESDGCWMEKDSAGWIRRIRDLMDSPLDHTSASQANIAYTTKYLKMNKATLERIFSQ